jgi:hypothetical protein
MHRLKNVIQRQKLVTAAPSATAFDTVRIKTEG